MNSTAFRRSQKQIVFCSLGIALLHPFGAAAQQSPGDTLTLSDAVRLAVERSPSVREAEAARATAHAGRWDSWGKLLPSVALYTGLSQGQALQRTASDPVTGGNVQLPDSLIRLRRTFSTSSALSANWTIFDGGRAIWGTRRANAEARAAGFAFDAARVRVAANVTLAYVSLLETDALVEARRTELERAKALVRVAEGRRQVGQIPEIELLQARLAEGDAEISLLDAETAAESARLVLMQHLGLTNNPAIVLRAPPVPAVSRLPTEDALRVCALERSAELAALRASRSAVERQAQAERWWFLPSVVVGATWVRSEFGKTREAITFDPRNEQTYYRVGFSWTPLEQPGRRIAERQRVHAAIRVAEARLDERRASITREVEVALGQLRRARLLGEQSSLNLQLAERQLEQASERYRLGVAPIVERLQAEALAKEAERQAITARYAALRALAEMERAAGVSVLRNAAELSCG